MDREIVKSRFELIKIRLVPLGIAVMVVLLVGYLYFVWDKKMVAAADLRIGEVHQGGFKIEVAGAGIFVPKEAGFVVAKVTGDVVDVNVSSGAHVDKDSVLFELSSEEITSSLRAASFNKAQAEGSLRLKEIELDSMMDQYKLDLLKATFEYAEAEAVYIAYEQLFRSKNPPLSRIEFMKTKHQKESAFAIAGFARESLSNFEKQKGFLLEEVKQRVKEAQEEHLYLEKQAAYLNQEPFARALYKI